MTREEILEMKPGRELDALIAEKVLGWITWEEKRGAYRYVVFQKPGEREPYMRFQNPDTYKDSYVRINVSQINHMKHIVCGSKDFSSDIACAWEVAEKLNTFCQLTRDFSPNNPRWHCAFSVTDSVMANSAPEAICKAALIAVLDL